MPKGVYIRTENHLKQLKKQAIYARQCINEESRQKISEALKGRHLSPATEFKKGDEKISGENHYFWKDIKVKYRGLHMWVVSKLVQPTQCEECGTDGLNGHEIHWANKSGRYLRELTDWLRLCVKCHKAYDLSRNQ